MMEFTLYYRGELKTHRDAKTKQMLRRHFHLQLKKLWEQLPLKEYVILLDSENDVNVIKNINGFNFASIVSQNLHLVAELKITFLRPEPAGSIVIHGGDIDNRLKTLLDALKIPSGQNEIPKEDFPQEGENPFFCLLEDDSLITKISIETDRLLDECSKYEVVLLIHVTTKVIKLMFKNMGLG